MLNLLGILLFTEVSVVYSEDRGVRLEDRGATVDLDNGVVAFVVRKADATIPRLTLGASPNLVGRGAYLAVKNSAGHDGWDLHNARFVVRRQTKDLVEISMEGTVGGETFTVYYILRRGDPGFYVMVEQERRPGAPPESIGQARWSLSLNPGLFDYHLASDTEQGPIPDLRGASMIQDATYRLPDGSIYTKYNYANYLEDDLVHGACGSGPSAYGAFIVSPGREYLQAPTKQELTVHAGPIIHRFLQSGHFEPRDLASPEIPEGWTKACGPWFVYLNHATSPRQLWADAQARGVAEEAQWPYAWVDHPDYPLARGEVSGILLWNQSPVAHALVVLAAPSPDWQVQVLGYLWSTRTDDHGRFDLAHVRPGTYTLSTHIPGYPGDFRRDGVVVVAAAPVNVGTLEWAESSSVHRLWQLGDADGRATGFWGSDQPRQYGLDRTIPAHLTFTIGQSVPARDWYYAQVKPGTWIIVFDGAGSPEGTGILTLGIAGQTNNPRLRVSVNQTVVGEYVGGNSSALYRSAILGSSYHELREFRFPGSVLVLGRNTVTLELVQGAVMYDAVRLAVQGPS